ncbi:MAG: hypothetical protein PVG38_12965 [Gammaproteobacteria bacterium]|jgi:hypothetical protein
MSSQLSTQISPSADTKSPQRRALHCLALLAALGHAAPFMHDGSLGTLEAAMQNYRDNSERARAGELRAGDPEMARIALSEQDLTDLVALIEALDSAARTIVRSFKMQQNGISCPQTENLERIEKLPEE